MAGSARRIVVEFIGDGSNLNRELNTLEGKTSRFGGVMGKTGKALGFGLGIAAGAAVKFGADSVASASLAQQSIGATETVFGKFADRVIKDSDKASTQFGLSANEYRENANLIGALFKNQGVASDELAGKTRNMIGTASDLAATFGGTTKEAVESLGSAFKGEFDPLEKYGISLKASTVTAEASALAQQQYGKSLEDLSVKQQTAMKQQATANLIQKQSADSAGAFARESDTLAHKQQVLAAQFENVKVKVGNVLLPLMTKFVGYLISDGIPAAQRAADKFREWWPTIEKVGRVTGDVIVMIAKFVGFVSKELWPIIKQTVENTAIGAKAVYDLGKSFVDIIADVVKFVRSIDEKIAAAKAVIKGFPDAAKAALGNLGSLLWSAGSDLIQGLIDGITAKVGALKDKLTSVTNLIPDWKGPREKDKILLKPAGVAIMQGLIDGIDKGKVKLKTVLQKLTDYISKHQDKLADLLSKKSAVVEAFRGFTSSIFGTDLSTGEGEGPATIQKLLDAGRNRRARAEQLNADVQTLLSKGLSRDLIQQMLDAGESGAEQIRLLATGSAEQIALANADNDATRQALEAAGLAVGDALFGNAIRQEEQYIKQADIIRDKLKELLDLQDKNTIVELHLDGHKIWVSLKKLKRQMNRPLELA